MKVVVGPYVLRDDGMGFGYENPEGLGGGIPLIDPLLDPQPKTNGRGVFLVSDVFADPDYTVLGDVDETVTEQIKSRLASDLGLEQSIQANQPRHIVYELLTRHALAENAERVPVLESKRTKRAVVRLSGREIFRRRIKPGDPEWPFLLRRLKNQFSRWREQAKDGKLNDDPEYHRRKLKWLMQKYGVRDHTVFGAKDDETPLPRSTTLTESYSDPNSNTYGTDLTWTGENGGDWDTVNNEGRKTTADSTHQHIGVDTSLSGDDMYSQVEYTGGATSATGPFTRRNNTNFTGYTCYRFSGTFYIRRYNSTVFSTVSSGSRTWPSTNGLFYLESDGSDHLAQFEGGLDLSGTDSTYSGVAHGGMFSYQGGVESDHDDFETGDLAVAQADFPFNYYYQAQGPAI